MFNWLIFLFIEYCIKQSKDSNLKIEMILMDITPTFIASNSNMVNFR